LTRQLVIAGAGHAAGQILATLRQQEYSGPVVVVGEETVLPYQRPPLSKKYLAGELPVERLLFKPESFYDALEVDFRLGQRVSEIDREARQVVTGTGDRITYDTLFLATGGRVRRLELPGCNLDGVHYLRTLRDSDGIRAALKEASRLAVVGAGYVGLEVAAVAKSLGVDVTIVESADRVLGRVVTPTLSAFFEAEHRRQGVRFELNASLMKFEGDRRIESLLLANGRSIEADAVVVGIGIDPNQEIARYAGLDTDDGIVTDAHCRTSDPSIYAVGDCNAHTSSIYNRRIRLESVQNALEQARIAVVNACGGDECYDQVPWFWSDQYDLKLQIAGLSEGYDEAITRGDPSNRSFSVAYLTDGRLIAVDAVNSPRDFLQAKALIHERFVPDPQMLADPAIQLKDVPAVGSGAA
jgi:3-phenylpropionate/trans-cinnamate dioxygenase ferredoxin reductase subunit